MAWRFLFKQHDNTVKTQLFYTTVEIENTHMVKPKLALPQIHRLLNAGCCLLLLTLLAAPYAKATPIKVDEEVTVIDTAAHWNEAAASWEVPLHVWVYEPEEDSYWRNLLAGRIQDHMDFADDDNEVALLRQRLRWFLVDNERNKDVVLNIADRDISLDKTEPNGHGYGTAWLDSSVAAQGQSLVVTVNLPNHDKRQFSGHVQLVPPKGISVISDIDDTIKISEISNRSAMLYNTLFKDFADVPEMSALYQRWAEAGAAFHYVSGSPWQLYPPLHEWLERSNFPAGSFHQRYVRYTDRTVFNLLKEGDEYKIPPIVTLFERFPEREFVMVGDMGEHDPEAYAKIYRRYPERVIHMYFRDPTPDANIPEDVTSRMTLVMDGIPRDKWTIFNEPKDFAETSYEILTKRH